MDKSLIFRMSVEEEAEFIDLVSVWRQGHDFPVEDCLFYNFGYERELPYPQILLDLDDAINITINTHGMQAPTSCSIILIAGFKLLFRYLL